MTAVRAVYYGKVFLPERPCKITGVSEIIFTIETVNIPYSTASG